jgi:hypothetical protein
MIVEAAPDYAVDIPLIWQYIGEIIGKFICLKKDFFYFFVTFSGVLIGGSTSNISLLKSVLQSVPDDKSKQLFQYIIRYATEFSVNFNIFFRNKFHWFSFL